MPSVMGDKYVNDSMVKLARHLGWRVLDVPRATASGLPFLKEMYFEAEKQFPRCIFYAYSNGDILFDGGLITSIEAVANVSLCRIMTKTL